MSTRRQFETLATPLLPPKPFVGLSGSESTVAIERRSDRMVCRLSAGALGFVETILVLFGGLLVFVSWLMWTGAEKAPMYFKIAVPALAMVCWAVFLRNLLGTPRIEIPYSSGGLLFFRRRTATPAFSIPRQQIRGLELSEVFFGSSSKQWRNYLVTVVTADGKRQALCASPQQDLMRSFMTDLAARTGVQGKDAAGAAGDLK